MRIRQNNFAFVDYGFLSGACPHLQFPFGVAIARSGTGTESAEGARWGAGTEGGGKREDAPSP